MSRILIGLSGGIDSTVALAQLLNQGHQVEGLYIHYGNKNFYHETDAAQRVAEHFKSPIHGALQLTQAFRLICPKSPMLDYYDRDLPTGHHKDPAMEQTIIPCRNLIFGSLLAGYAEAHKFDGICLGIQGSEGSLYPDCRLVFISALQTAISYATDRQFRLTVPLARLDKVEVIRLGTELGVPFRLTRTCWGDQRLACGQCGACSKRLEAFQALDLTDPIEYETGKKNNV